MSEKPPSLPTAAQPPDPADFQALLWREGLHRCELWMTAAGQELRLYASEVLTYRELVLWSTSGLRQAAVLLAKVQAPNR